MGFFSTLFGKVDPAVQAQYDALPYDVRMAGWDAVRVAKKQDPTLKKMSLNDEVKAIVEAAQHVHDQNQQVLDDARETLDAERAKSPKEEFEKFGMKSVVFPTTEQDEQDDADAEDEIASDADRLGHEDTDGMMRPVRSEEEMAEFAETISDPEIRALMVKSERFLRGEFVVTDPLAKEVIGLARYCHAKRIISDLSYRYAVNDVMTDDKERMEYRKRKLQKDMKAHAQAVA